MNIVTKNIREKALIADLESEVNFATDMLLKLPVNDANEKRRAEIFCAGNACQVRLLSYEHGIAVLRSARLLLHGDQYISAQSKS